MSADTTKRLSILALVGLVLPACPWTHRGYDPRPEPPAARDYDAREDLTAGVTVLPSPAQEEAENELRRRVPELLVAYDPKTGTVGSLGAFAAALSSPAPGDPMNLALDFVADHLALLGLESTDVADLVPTDAVPGRDGTTHLSGARATAGSRSTTDCCRSRWRRMAAFWLSEAASHRWRRRPIRPRASTLPGPCGSRWRTSDVRSPGPARA